MSLWQDIARHISETSGSPFEPIDTQPLGGGCINNATRLSDGTRSWFVKTNDAELLTMFEAEAEGLNALADAQAIKVPRALCTGKSTNTGYIVMDSLSFAPATEQGQTLAGQQLAELHRSNMTQFGWQRDNTIGATHQGNDWHEDWIDFWREQRLGFQLKLAAQNGYKGHLQNRGEQLLARFHVLINHAPQASLLHGDLWGGNMRFDQHGQPVIFDPAVYYGDRETDIAMTELFGGFSDNFYRAYRQSWPLDDGYPVRRTLYNLYHILNHLNLFGSGYARQAETMIDRLLAHC